MSFVVYVPTAQEKAVRDWVASALAIECIFEGDRGPRPAKPYGSVSVLSETENGHPDETTTDEVLGAGFKHVVTSRNEGTASVVIHGPGSVDRARALRFSLLDQAVKDANDDNGLVVAYRIADTTRALQMLDTAYEERAGGDYLFRYTDTAESEVQAVETVAITEA